MRQLRQVVNATLISSLVGCGFSTDRHANGLIYGTVRVVYSSEVI